MSPRMLTEANAVLNARDEGRVEAVIELFKRKYLDRWKEGENSRAILKLWINELWPDIDVDYWLNWFGVND